MDIRKMISLVENVNDKLKKGELEEANKFQSIEAGAESLMKALRNEKGIINDIAPKLRELGYFKAGEKVSAQQVEGLFKRIKNGSISNVEAERVMKGLREIPAVKQGFLSYIRETPKFSAIKNEILPKGSAMAHDQIKLAKTQKFFADTYGLSPEETNSLFGLPKDAKVTVIPKTGGLSAGEIKPGEVKPGEIKPGEIKPGEAESGLKPGETPKEIENPLKPGETIPKEGITFPYTTNGKTFYSPSELEGYIKNGGGVNVNQSVNVVIKDMESAKAATKDPAVIGTIEKDIQEVTETAGKVERKKLLPSILKKLKIGWLVKLGLVGGAGYLLYRLVRGGTNEPDRKGFGDCVWGIGKSPNGGYDSKDGELVVTLTKTGNQTYDSHGGLKFWPGDEIKKTGNVFYGDMTRRGTWSCVGNKVEATPTKVEEETEPRNLYEWVFSPNKQNWGKDLNSDVDDMIDLLDFPVYGNDLQNALELLTIYKNNGKGKEFLNRYQKSGLGSGDLEKSITYVAAISAKSSELKEKLMAMVKEMKGEGSNTNTDTNTAGDVLSNVKIVWDDEVGPAPVPDDTNKTDDENKKTEDLVYRDCVDFPFGYGCRNEKIKEMQTCLGFEERYQTGNFGPITRKALGGSNEITLDMYDEVMKKCKQESSETGDQNTSTEQPTNQETEPTDQEPTTDQNQEPEVHHDTDSETGEPIERPKNVVEPSEPDETGEDLFNKWNGSYFRKKLMGPQKIGQNRLYYKGPDLTKTDFDKLNDYLEQNGYIQTNDKHGKRYGDKYVWRLRENEPQEEPTTEPESLQEQRIKNIVSKHLRSKL